MQKHTLSAWRRTLSWCRGCAGAAYACLASMEQGTQCPGGLGCHLEHHSEEHPPSTTRRIRSLCSSGPQPRTDTANLHGLSGNGATSDLALGTLNPLVLVQ